MGSVGGPGGAAGGPPSTASGRELMEETTEKIDPELQSHLIEVAKQLSQSIRMRGFYPKGHGAIAASIRKLGESLAVLLEGREVLTIAAAGEELLFDGCAFGTESKPCRRLASHFKVRDLKGVTFRRGVTDGELEAAIEMLSADRESSEAGEWPPAGSSSRCDHIDFGRIRYDEVLRHVSEEEAESVRSDDIRELWHTLLSGDSKTDDRWGEDGTAAGCSPESRSALGRLSQELSRAGESGDGRRPALLVKGMRMTCDTLAKMPKERRDDSTTFLAGILQQMDPKMALTLIERAGEAPHSKEDDVASEIARKLTTEAKLAVLAAVVKSRKDNPGRLSSVFSRVVGVEKRRMELLRKIEQEAIPGAGGDDRKLDAVMSAVQELVISEAEDRFVGSGYGSLLEELSDDSMPAPVLSESDAEHLALLRRSLCPDGMPATTASFLTDLAGLQESESELRTSLGDLTSTCRSLCERKDFEPVVDAARQVAGYLAAPGDRDKHGNEALRECLRSLLIGGAGSLILERLARVGPQSEGTLSAALDAAGESLCGEVCDLAAASDSTLQNEHVLSYLRAHAGTAAEHCAEIMQDSTPPYAKRTLKALAALGTPEALAVMRSALAHHDRGVQSEAVRTLAAIRTEEANAILHDLLSGEDHELARTAAASLGESASPEAAMILTESLALLDFFGRRIPEVQNVAAALGRMGHRGAVPQLERILNRRLWTGSAAKRRLRETVAQSLRNMDGDEAESVLRRGAASRNKGVREVCKVALNRPRRRRGAMRPAGVDGDRSDDM
jgi:hypothetical protein